MPAKGRGGEVAFLAATVGVALFLLGQALGLPLFIRGSLGPGLYPALVLAAVTLVALVLLVRTLATREIRIYSPFLEGLQHDRAVRALAAAAGASLGAPVRVLARTGSGRFSALEIARRAPADGSAIGLVTSETADLPNLEAAAFALDNFVPVVRLWFEPDAIVVRADAPWADLAGLFANQRPRPLRIGFLHGERGAAPIRAWLARHGAGPVDAVHVDDAAGLLRALGEGRLDAAVAAVAEVDDALAAGGLRCLAALSDEPVRARAGAPATSRQQGFPLASGRWGGLMLPRGSGAEGGALGPERLYRAFADASLRVDAPRSGDDGHADAEERPRWSVLPPAEFAGFLGAMRNHARAFDPGGGRPALARGKVEGLVVAVAGIFLFAPLMGVLGFPLAAAVFLAGLMLLLWSRLDARGLATIAGVAIGVALGLDHLFRKVFYVVFPSGVIWGP